MLLMATLPPKSTGSRLQSSSNSSCTYSQALAFLSMKNRSSPLAATWVTSSWLSSGTSLHSAIRLLLLLSEFWQLQPHAYTFLSDRSRQAAWVPRVICQGVPATSILLLLTLGSAWKVQTRSLLEMMQVICSPSEMWTGYQFFRFSSSLTSVKRGSHCPWQQWVPMRSQSPMQHWKVFLSLKAIASLMPHCGLMPSLRPQRSCIQSGQSCTSPPTVSGQCLTGAISQGHSMPSRPSSRPLSFSWVQMYLRYWRHSPMRQYFLRRCRRKARWMRMAHWRDMLQARWANLPRARACILTMGPLYLLSTFWQLRYLTLNSTWLRYSLYLTSRSLRRISSITFLNSLRTTHPFQVFLIMVAFRCSISRQVRSKTWRAASLHFCSFRKRPIELKKRTWACSRVMFWRMARQARRCLYIFQVEPILVTDLVACSLIRWNRFSSRQRLTQCWILLHFWWRIFSRTSVTTPSMCRFRCPMQVSQLFTCPRNTAAWYIFLILSAHWIRFLRFSLALSSSRFSADSLMRIFLCPRRICRSPSSSGAWRSTKLRQSSLQSSYDLLAMNMGKLKMQLSISQNFLRNSLKGRRQMQPSLRIRIESSTPRYRRLCSTPNELNMRGDLKLLGLMQRTKWQSEAYSSSVSLFISLRNFDPRNLLAALRDLGAALSLPTMMLLRVELVPWTMTSLSWTGNSSLLRLVKPWVEQLTGEQEWMMRKRAGLERGMRTNLLPRCLLTMTSGRSSSLRLSSEDSLMRWNSPRGYSSKRSMTGLLSWKQMSLEKSLRPCLRKSFCSSLKMYDTYSCCSFSLAKLMKNCSSELVTSTSNPKMSSSPMLFRNDLFPSSRFIFSSSIFSLSLVTRKQKVFSYMFLAKESCRAAASLSLRGESITVMPILRVLNWKQCSSWAQSTSISCATILRYSELVSTAISSLLLLTSFLNSRLPMLSTMASTFRMHCTSSGLKQLLKSSCRNLNLSSSLTPLISCTEDWFRYLYFRWESCSISRAFSSGEVPFSRQQNMWQLRSPSATDTILLFSSRQLMITALLMSTWVSPQSSRISLPKREELSFRMVLALPNASRISLQPRILSSMPASLPSRMPFMRFLPTLALTTFQKFFWFLSTFMFLPSEARNLRQYLVFSVLPAPDSPLMTIDWLRQFSNSCQRQKAASPQTWGQRFLYSRVSMKAQVWYSYNTFSLKSSSMQAQGLMITSVGPQQVKMWSRKQRRFRLYSSSGSFSSSRSTMSGTSCASYVSFWHSSQFTTCSFASQLSPSSSWSRSTTVILSGEIPMTFPSRKMSSSLLNIWELANTQIFLSVCRQAYPSRSTSRWSSLFYSYLLWLRDSGLPQTPFLTHSSSYYSLQCQGWWRLCGWLILLIVDALVKEEQGGVADPGQAQAPRAQGVHRQQGPQLPGQLQVPLRAHLRQHEHQQLQNHQGNPHRLQVPHGQEQSHRGGPRHRRGQLVQAPKLSRLPGPQGPLHPLLHQQGLPGVQTNLRAVRRGRVRHWRHHRPLHHRPRERPGVSQEVPALDGAPPETVGPAYPPGQLEGGADQGLHCGGGGGAHFGGEVQDTEAAGHQAVAVKVQHQERVRRSPLQAILSEACDMLFCGVCFSQGLIISSNRSMGETQSAHKCSYLDLLTFVQSANDANFGPIDIYRTQEAPYEYVMDFRKNFIEDDTRLNNYRALMQRVQQVEHKNIARIHGCELVEETQLCIKHKRLHTFCHYYNFTLEGAVEKKKIMDSSFPESELIYIMGCLLEAACHLMEHGICHGDYRAPSIYLSPQGYVKLYLLQIDGQNRHTSYYRTLGDSSNIDQYVFSPQQLQALHQMDHQPKFDKFKAEVFAIGMVILELITLDKTKFYYNQTRTELKIERISFDLCSVGKHFSDQFVNLLKYCLQPNPAKRCSLPEALSELNSLRKTTKAVSYCIRLQEEEGAPKPMKREITMSVKGQHILNGLQKRLTPSPITTLASSVQPMLKVEARMAVPHSPL